MAVTDEAINKMKQLIVSGTLSAGSKLPRDSDLAADLQISATSLRETLGALIGVHILEDRDQEGIFVSSLDADLMLEAMDFLLEFHLNSSILDFFGVRRILEPAAAAMAARQMGVEAVAELRNFADQATTTMSIPELVDHDLALHQRIALGAQNPVLASMLQSIGAPTRRARIWRGLTQNNAFEQTLAEHSGIVEAVERHDPDLAYARTLVHIAAIEDSLRATHDPTRDVPGQLPEWNIQRS